VAVGDLADLSAYYLNVRSTICRPGAIRRRLG